MHSAIAPGLQVDAADLDQVAACIMAFASELMAWRTQFCRIDLQEPSTAVLDPELEKHVVAFLLQARVCVEPPRAVCTHA